MRKLLLIILTSLVTSSVEMKAQIILDTILGPVMRGTDFYMAQISPTETKYVFLDTISNTFSLHNMDFTPFLSNISVPEPFALTTAQMQPVYITRALFDCDTSNIEYAFESPVNSYHKPFRIMRTDGTQLFYLDSANGPYCLGGCLGMSDVIVPIKNTSAGTKLWLQKTNSANIFIYSLCGDLPTSIFDFTSTNQQSFIKVFPNPTQGYLAFDITLPDNLAEYQLVIITSEGKEISRQRIVGQAPHLTIDTSNLSNGTYYYSLCTRNRAYQSGKFILNKF